MLRVSVASTCSSSSVAAAAENCLQRAEEELAEHNIGSGRQERNLRKGGRSLGIREVATTERASFEVVAWIIVVLEGSRLWFLVRVPCRRTGAEEREVVDVRKTE
ncbi:unnamed protein product [Calypogeia fissa]